MGVLVRAYHDFMGVCLCRSIALENILSDVDNNYKIIKLFH